MTPLEYDSVFARGCTNDWGKLIFNEVTLLTGFNTNMYKG